MRIIIVLLFAMCMSSCADQEPRKPLQTKTGSFFTESVLRSKKLLEKEEQHIQEIIKNDSLKNYRSTASGSWYHYNTISQNTNYTPQADDLIVFNYDILTLENDTIYSKEEIGIVHYKVDKQDLFIGLRDAVKLLKLDESATFLFPSSLAYGYHGDNKKIKSNTPLKATVTILNIEKK